MTSLPDPRIENLEWEPEFDLSKTTSMGVGGRALAMATVHSESALQEFQRLSHRSGWRVWRLGGGSNTIFIGERFEGVVLRLGREFGGVEVEAGNILRAGAAANLSAACKLAERSGLSGLEFCMGIPGQVGGALAGNAGQQGEAICELVESARGYTQEGDPALRPRGEFAFSYRKSDLATLALVEARFLLKPSEPSAIESKMKRFLAKRWEQPVGLRSSGCIFKNPAGDFAGRLIDVAGLKGFAIGDAGVAAEHANFIVNRRHASAGEVVALIEHVRKTVRDRFGVELELEVRLVD